jgi:hypothetical protein
MRTLVFFLLLLGAPAFGQRASDDPEAMLRVAQAHLAAGQFEDAVRLAVPLGRDTRLGRADRAEAWRVAGLALFQLGRRDSADAAFFEYLKLEPEAHLDPNLNSAEVVLFLEEVRARHAGELARYKHRPRKRRVAALNLLPPWGQFQNDQQVKAWSLGVVEGALLVTNIGSWLILDSMCDPADGTCGDSADAARAWQKVNIASGVLLIGAVAYGIVDGFWVHRRLTREEEMGYSEVGFVPTERGGVVVFSGRF